MSTAGGLAKSRGLLRFQARSSESPERVRLAGVKEASHSAELFGRSDVQAQPSLNEGVSGEGMIFQLDDAGALSDVHSQGLRALSCPIDILVDGSGQPGVDGVHGSRGVPGKDGQDGAPGKAGYGPARPGKPGGDGKDGKPGMAGKKGQKGGNGTSGGRGANFHVELFSSDALSVRVAGFMELPASPVLQTLDFNQPHNADTVSTPGGVLRHPLQLQRPSSGDSGVNGTVEATEDKPADVSLEPGRFIVIRASGGRGGRGGNGGNGGNGGRGGSGGSGGKGGDGKKGLKPGMNGENGGHGGAGGNGMPGGAGGEGGSAGKGGNAGAGGRVVVQTTDPTLLMLVEVDVRPGLPGEAGIPGMGGTGGESGKAGGPGPPGIEGPGWDKLYLRKSRKTKHYTCHSGTRGRLGKMGAAGSPPALMGSPGLPADAGKEARPGQVTWIVKSHDGEILERGKDRYNCVVTHFRVQSSSKDGVIRPGGEVLIDQVEVCNTGGITLPAGTRLFFQETAVLLSIDKNRIETLPAIRPHRTHKSKRVFRMRVTQLASPVGGSCFNATTAVVPCVDLLGRPFRSSDNLLEIPLRYPVQIVGDVELPHTVRKGDVVVAKVRLRNISAGVYGSSSNMSLGAVTVMVLMFVELEDGRRVECSWKKDAEYIAPSEDCILGISCHINDDTLAYSLTSVQVHLLLGGQSVEYRHLESRVVPVYEKAKEAVFITDSQLKPKEYVAWKYVLAILGLEHVCWDVTWHCTFAPSEVAWLGGHNVVIFPHVPQDHGLLHWIRMVLPWHVHTLGGPASAENAGAIVMGPYPKDVSRHMINWESLATTKVVKTSRFRVSCFGDTEDRAARRAATQALHFQDQLNAQNQNQFNFVVSPSMKRGSALVKLRAYREILPAMFRLRAAPIEAVSIPSGFFPEPSTEVKEEVSDDVFGFERWSPTLSRSNTERPATQHLWSPIPLWSPFGFAISAMLVYLPIKFKLRVLAHFHSYPPGQLPLYFTSNVSFIQVIGLGLYYDVKMDWYSRRDSLPHGELLVAEIERLVSSGQWSGWSLTQDYVYALTGGLIHFRSELSSRLLSGRSSKAKTTVNALIERVQAAICRGEMKFPTEKQIKQVYDGLAVLPPWLFADVTEKPPIQIVYE